MQSQSTSDSATTLTTEEIAHSTFSASSDAVHSTTSPHSTSMPLTHPSLSSDTTEPTSSEYTSSISNTSLSSTISATSFLGSTADQLNQSTKLPSTSSQNSVPTSPSSPSTITVNSCTDCQCNGAPCFFNVTSGLCECICSDYTYGDSCSFAVNTRPVILSEERPTRKANISLRILKEYNTDYGNLNSEASKKLISILSHGLSGICRRAAPQNFRDVKILRLLPGSIIVKSIAVYNYPNNQSQIDFLNKDLQPSLIKLFDSPDILQDLSQALGNVSVQDEEILMQTAEIEKISDLKPYLNCSSDFANYTLNLVEGAWVCEGPCKQNPGYCNAHGDCVNVKTGPMCLCYKSSFEEYYGPQCELFRRGAGFYGALFGSLGAALLLFITVTIGIVVVRMRRCRCWSLSSSYDSSHSSLSLFGDYFFDFTERGHLQKYTMHNDLRDAEAAVFN
ncbi:mucin-3B [Tachysurus fulvidraco]|uniref:mucin-3B n=1 Tax=Tachysurus fulvidraco TaxID=1234273 RepID=UPI001FEFB201|nr:mucin-3B [Tachysurus fulvidraco]